MNLIVARGINGEIGANNKLLWNLPGDMKHFRETTKGTTVVMGRKTWESIGCKPLPNRTNIVITRNPECSTESLFFMTLEQFIWWHEHVWRLRDEIFVIGGAELYYQLDCYINVMYITEVEKNFPEADTFFRGLNGHWDTEFLKSGEDNGVKYKIYKHTRSE